MNDPFPSIEELEAELRRNQRNLRDIKHNEGMLYGIPLTGLVIVLAMFFLL